jgi:hypothetical protein
MTQATRVVYPAAPALQVYFDAHLTPYIDFAVDQLDLGAWKKRYLRRPSMHVYRLSVSARPRTQVLPAQWTR